jgi:hypothetical protein
MYHGMVYLAIGSDKRISNVVYSPAGPERLLRDIPGVHITPAAG